jgi:uncharacterized protein
MQATATKELLQHIFDETAAGNGRPFVDALHDDVVWRIIGTTSWSRTFIGKASVLKDLLAPLRAQFEGANTIVAHRILCDGDYAVVEARGRNTTTAGKRYENEYCWVIEMKDGQMKSIVEYADTALMESALAPLQV